MIRWVKLNMWDMDLGMMAWDPAQTELRSFWICQFHKTKQTYNWRFKGMVNYLHKLALTGTDPGFFLGGGALVFCSTSTPINHIVFFFAEYQLY